MASACCCAKPFFIALPARSGKLVIPYKYNIEYEGETSSFSNGKTNVTDDKGEYCINKKGAKVTC